MSIYEQAQQLSAVAEQVPVGMSVEIINQLESLQGQITAILGDTQSAQELMGQAGAGINEAQTLSAGLEQLRQMITERAMYHQQG